MLKLKDVIIGQRVVPTKGDFEGRVFTVAEAVSDTNSWVTLQDQDGEKAYFLDEEFEAASFVPERTHSITAVDV